MIRSLSPLLLVLGILVAGPAARAADQAAPPNIVLIISDDQAWTDYSFMGHPHIKTPHLDKLASQSLLFTRGYVPSSLCCPSLVTILTGQYPHQHRITSNDPPLPPGSTRANAARNEAFRAARKEMISFIDDAPTLPRLLAQKGYLSFQTGKWWQGNFSRGGFTHGMTHGDPTQGGRHGDAGLDIGRKGLKPIYDFIDTARQEQKPFLVWYAPFMPHTPHTPPERLLEKYKKVAPTERIAAYWAMCEWFDETCGELMAHLEEQKLAENTIVVYVTDNGWIQDPVGGNYAPKSKQSQYDGGLRTPIMIRWTGKVQPAKSEQLANSIDIAPTLLNAVGLKPASDMPGLNLLDPPVVAARKTIFGECFTHNAIDLQNPAASLRWRWTIENHWKLIVPDPRNEPGPIELYDLAADPHEEKNLAAENPEVVQRLRGALDAWWPAK